MCNVMCRELRTIWWDSSFLIFRWVRLAIACLQFALPYNVLCLLAEYLGSGMHRKRRSTSLLAYKINYAVSESYILAKFLIPLLLLTCFQVKSLLWEVTLIVLVSETVFYLLSIVLVPTNMGAASHPRSAFFLLLAFASCTLSFAYIYWNLGDISGVSCPSQALYFSVVTASTTGYGDLNATSTTSRAFVLFQIATSVMFLVSFFPVFFARILGRAGTNQPQ
jgi:hypothetical protein